MFKNKDDILIQYLSIGQISHPQRPQENCFTSEVFASPICLWSTRFELTVHISRGVVAWGKKKAIQFERV